MKKILKVDNPNVYAKFVNAPVLHPLVSIIHYDELAPFRHSLNNYGVYGLFIQRKFCNEMSYGNKQVLVANDSILSVAPGQMGGVEDNGELFSLNGWVILWSPELISEEQSLARKYPFFSYFFNTPLVMEPAEWDAITQLLNLMRKELEQQEDSSILRKVIVSYLKVILEYCNRIYFRQKEEKETNSSDLLLRFQNLLDQYYEQGLQQKMGVPSVTYCAKELAYSPPYFGDMIRKLTGQTAISYIHDYIINQAKSLLMNGYNVNETADMLGFDYTNHFTRIFKKKTGMTPSEYR